MDSTQDSTCICESKRRTVTHFPSLPEEGKDVAKQTEMTITTIKDRLLSHLGLSTFDHRKDFSSREVDTKSDR